MGSLRGFEGIPSEWSISTLGEVCRAGGGTIQTGPFGSQLHASDYVPVGIPSVMPVNIGDNRIIPEGIARVSQLDAERLSRHRLREGDIVYSRRGDVERRALVRSEQNGWLCGTGCLLVRLGPRSTVHSAYAAYFLGHPEIRAWIVRHAVGATMANLNTQILSSVPFVIPPQNEQRAIATVLGVLEEKLELNRRMNETLEAMARALFQSWFVDFDPVRAKAEGRQPFGMDASTAALFPTTFENAALGEVPKGWRAASLAEVADLNPQSWTKTTYPNSIEYVDLANTKWGRVEATTSCSKEEAPSRAQRVLRRGDTIVGTVRPGNGSFALVMQDGLTGSTGFAVLRPRSPNAVGFVYLSATRRENIMTLAHLADGGAYPAVRPEVVIQQPAVVPPDPVLSAFARVVDPLLGRCAQADSESQSLIELRDYLLPKLLSGELRVRGAEKLVEAAT